MSLFGLVRGIVRGAKNKDGSNEIRYQDLTERRDVEAPADGGRLIVLTSPLSEITEGDGYFIQMTAASLPIWLEGILDSKYPDWKNVKYNEDGSAGYVPSGLRTLEKKLGEVFGAENVVCCFPDDLDKFIGPNTRVMAVSTMNPLGVTFAAGVYTSMFGTSKETINSHYAKEMFGRARTNPFRDNFKVIVGGTGGWQINSNNMFEQLSVDCVIEGRSESDQTMEIFHQAVNGEEVPQYRDVVHPPDRDKIMVPTKRTTFGVVEMTTGCGRRCRFCAPDLNPQIDVSKEKIMKAVEANLAEGNNQISLATEDFFIWGQVDTDTPFYFPNREKLLDLFQDVTKAPELKHHVLSHCTIAPAVVDPILIRKMSESMLEKSPLHYPTLSDHPKGKAFCPLIGVETGSVRMAKKVMPSKAVPFSIDDWPSVVIQGLTVLNANNWFPALTLMVGNPGETDEDVKDTLDMLGEIERRGLFGYFIPSIFTPLEDTRMEEQVGVTQTKQLSPLQWQLIMKCWKMNAAPALRSWWGPSVWRIGAFLLWVFRLRKTNGPNFTWPLQMFAGTIPEKLLAKMGKIYIPQPIKVKTRKELLSSIRPKQWKYLREDTGDMPDEFMPTSEEAQEAQELVVLKS